MGKQSEEEQEETTLLLPGSGGGGGPVLPGGRGVRQPEAVQDVAAQVYPFESNL
jgi:hypothetical protein